MVDTDLLKQSIKTIQQSVGSASRNFEEAAKAQILSQVEVLSTALNDKTYWASNWTTVAKKAVNTFRIQLPSLGLSVPDGADGALDEIEEHAESLANDEALNTQARQWVVNQMPVFVYLSDYPEIEGHQHIGEYLSRKSSGQQTEADIYFEKLCKVAGLNPEELNSLSADDHERRQQLVNRAGALITGKLRKLWTDRELKVRFNLDGAHLDTYISDPTSTYDVEVNLNERSRGFRWFFSFYITFTADTSGGSAHNAILLLDEPGLYLHAVAQRDLLKHFKADFKNQIIFTTHSPFMIPVDELDSVRTVNISQEQGTTVSNDPIGDEKTLFPLQTALGYSTTQALFIGEKNIVVEGVSDYWYISAASDYLNDSEGAGISAGITLTPAGGAQRVSYMVSLLASHDLHVVVLLDEEPFSRNTAEELKKAKLIREEGVVFVSEAFTAPPKGGADIEDLLEPAVFDALMTEAFAKELGGNTLSLNANIPRIAKRYEEALKAAGIAFNKTRPARLFLKYLGENPSHVMSEPTKNNFRKVFSRLNSAVEKQAQADRKPFR